MSAAPASQNTAFGMIPPTSESAPVAGVAIEDVEMEDANDVSEDEGQGDETVDEDAEAEVEMSMTQDELGALDKGLILPPGTVRKARPTRFDDKGLPPQNEEEDAADDDYVAPTELEVED